MIYRLCGHRKTFLYKFKILQIGEQKDFDQHWIDTDFSRQAVFPPNSFAPVFFLLWVSPARNPWLFGARTTARPLICRKHKGPRSSLRLVGVGSLPLRVSHRHSSLQRRDTRTGFQGLQTSVCKRAHEVPITFGSVRRNYYYFFKVIFVNIPSFMFEPQSIKFDLRTFN